MEIIYAIEAMLFAKGEAVEIKDIAQALEVSVKDTKDLIEKLIQIYKEEKRGLDILYIEDKVQLCSSSEYFSYIRKVCEVPKKHDLSPAVMETLAIIAYKQPVTRAEIEDIRGVSASFAINKLMEYGLICEKGRLDIIGKPIVFGTTDEFLKYFGVSNLAQLPTISND